MSAHHPPLDHPGSAPAETSTRNPSIPELITIAMTLLTVPGIVLYLAVIICLQVWEISLAGNLIAPLLLACIGLVLFILVLMALSTGIWISMKTKMPSRIILLCTWLNGIVLASLIALAILSPPLQ